MAPAEPRVRFPEMTTLDPSAPTGKAEAHHRPHVCPWWLGWLLVHPLRRLLESPEGLLGPHVREGSRVLEVGPAMGFFTVPLARMVGSTGKVIAVELQEDMIRALAERLKKQGFTDRVEVRSSTTSSLGVLDLEHNVDLAVAIHVVHETEEPRAMLSEISHTLRSGGRLYLREPAHHCSRRLFEEELRWAIDAGLELVEERSRGLAFTALLGKP